MALAIPVSTDALPTTPSAPEMTSETYLRALGWTERKGRWIHLRFPGNYTLDEAVEIQRKERRALLAFDLNMSPSAFSATMETYLQALGWTERKGRWIHLDFAGSHTLKDAVQLQRNERRALLALELGLNTEQFNEAFGEVKTAMKGFPRPRRIPVVSLVPLFYKHPEPVSPPPVVPPPPPSEVTFKGATTPTESSPSTPAPSSEPVVVGRPNARPQPPLPSFPITASATTAKRSPKPTLRVLPPEPTTLPKVARSEPSPPPEPKPGRTPTGRKFTPAQANAAKEIAPMLIGEGNRRDECMNYERCIYRAGRFPYDAHCPSKCEEYKAPDRSLMLSYFGSLRPGKESIVP